MASALPAEVCSNAGGRFPCQSSQQDYFFFFGSSTQPLDLNTAQIAMEWP